MTISYPLSLPDSSIARTTITARNSVGITVNKYNAKQQVYDWQTGMWMLGIEVAPMVRADAEAWQCFLLMLRGPVGTFLAGDDTAGTPRGVATGTPLVKGASQTGFSLITDGWTATTTGILKAGDFIQVGTGTSTRLYKVLQDTNSDGSGNATFDIFPELRESPADNAPITVSNCKGVFRLLDSDVLVTSIDSNKIHSISLSAIEAY